MQVGLLDMNKTFLPLLLLSVSVVFTSTAYAEEGGHKEESHKSASDGDEHQDDHQDEAGNVSELEQTGSASLNKAQKKLAGIEVGILKSDFIDYEVYAPGVLMTNGYTSYQVSPRVASLVLRRHTTLGEHVTKGQPLVTLFSEALAQAQVDYRKAYPEWQRINGLGRSVVGEQRFNAAKAEFEATRAMLLAYGLSTNDMDTLKDSNVGSLGEYTLRARIDGAVLTDDFEQGQRVEAGQSLITLADENDLWVEASLPASSDIVLEPGSEAGIKVGDLLATAKVSQQAHTIDPITRTRTVRLDMANPEHRFHPGMFAGVYFRLKTQESVLAVPESALMRGADGDWAVFVEAGEDEYKPIEVELGRSIGGLREISGIAGGARVVLQGAFFVASEIAKDGFDPHNH